MANANQEDGLQVPTTMTELIGPDQAEHPPSHSLQKPKWVSPRRQLLSLGAVALPLIVVGVLYLAGKLDQDPRSDLIRAALVTVLSPIGVLGAAALGFALAIIIRVRPDKKELLATLSTELLSIAFTILALGFLIQYQDVRQTRTQLIRDLGGESHEFALRAARELAREGWLSSGVLIHIDLRGARLSDAYLVGANLSNSNLAFADLSGAKLRKANLSGANLSQANLSGSSLWEADFANANLSFADLSETDLTGANLSGVELFGTKLSHAILEQTNLSNANLGPVVDLGEPEGSGTEVADLSNLDLWGANLSNANLYQANMSGAVLVDAKLIGAYLVGANMQDANLTNAVVYGAVFDDATVWPEGFDPIQAGAVKAVESLDSP